MNFELRIYSNSHYKDESESYLEKGFATYDDALNRAKKITEDFLIENWRDGMTAEDLLKMYKTFGEDQVIIPTPGDKELFSAWNHAEKSVSNIIKKLSPGRPEKSDELLKEWTTFIQFTKNEFNPPATESELYAAENELGFEIPAGLKELYRLSNGQKASVKQGVFKNVSGANIYTRVKFIDTTKLQMAYKMICSDPELVNVFNNDLLPFAIEKEKKLGNCYAISLSSQKIYLLWTDYPDFFNPPDWQIWQIFRGHSMLDFLKYQNMLFF